MKKRFMPPKDRAGLEFRVTVSKDRSGYQVVDRPLDKSQTIISVSGLHIERCSGRVERVRYESSERRRIWRHAILVKTPEDLVNFQVKWGEILTPTISVAYSKDILNRLRNVAEVLKNESRDALKQLSHSDYFRFKIDPESGTLFIEARNLIEFMRIEVWMELANGRPMQECPHCRTLFRTGGQMGIAKRADAVYCKSSCRVMASRARVKAQEEKNLTFSFRP